MKMREKYANMLKISKIIIIVIGFILINTTTSISTINFNQKTYLIHSINNENSYIDISPEDAWVLLDDTSNGIQYPIDVRTNSEWKSGHIDTPYPENPNHHNFYDWGDQEILQEVLTSYQGKEIIVYCKAGSRSVSAINTLIDNGFSGTIYNMLGGIDSWISSGLPTVPNRPPETPNINGYTSGQAGEQYEFTLSVHDPDFDEVFYYINWSDNTGLDKIGPFDSETETKVNHSWQQNGIFSIQVKAEDVYEAESDWQTFDFSILETELEISNIKGGFGSISADVKNSGEYIAENVTIIINVNGGLFSNINLTHSCSGCSKCGTTLDPGKIKTENTRESNFIFGFGKINITISADATNSNEIRINKTGFVFGPFVQVS